MDTQSEHWQAEDEEKAFFRCVELVQMVQRREKFSQQDIEDLKHHLGVSNYFKEKSHAESA